MNTTQTTQTQETKTAEAPVVIMYGHAACPWIAPAKAMLNDADVPYQYIDIHADQDAAARVRTINGGNESVPTFEFPDGSTLTEPSAVALRRKLRDAGYRISMMGMVKGSFWLWMPLLLAVALFIIGWLT